MTYMEIDNFLGILRSKGTVTDLKSDPIPESHLKKILKAARWSPSAANSQPWELILVEGESRKKEIGRIMVNAQKQAKKRDEIFPYRSEDYIWERIVKPPVLIVVCADTRFKKAYPKAGYRDQNIAVSMGIVIQNMILAAKSLDLELSWGTVNRFAREKLRELLDIPEYLLPFEVLKLGYPKENKKPGKRRKVEEFTHREGIKKSKLRTESEIKELISSRNSPDVYSG